MGMTGEAQRQSLVILVRVMVAKTTVAGDTEGSLRVVLLKV
jgi:hypothetical protein